MNSQLLTIFLGFQQQEEAVDQIKEKIANDPDGYYEMGVVIAAYLPFVFLIVFAYVTFYLVKKAKAKKHEDIDLL